MEWTYEHDVMFCKEVRLMQPFKAKKGSPERGRIWNLIAESLNQIDKPKFRVNKRSVKERFNLLAEKYKTKIRNEEKASGISPEITELDMLLEEILALEEEMVTQIHAQDKVSEEKGKAQAQEMRKKALEKLGETQKRKADQGEEHVQQKKHRTSGSETIAYLRQRAEENMKLKVEEQQAQRDMQVSFQQQQQQQQMLHAFHKQSEQQHNALLALSQQQQLQNQMLLALIQKLVSK